MTNRQVPPQPGANGSQAKGATKNTTFSAGASFGPSLGLNVNINGSGNGNRGGNRGAGARWSESPNAGGSGLPAPEFTSPTQVREYCNSVRAAMAMMAFELAMGAEIMKATLAQVPDPEGRVGASRVRAWKVARKLSKSADAALDAAKNAAATYAAFQREYEEEINRVRHRARRPQTPRMDWNQQ